MALHAVMLTQVQITNQGREGMHQGWLMYEMATVQKSSHRKLKKRETQRNNKSAAVNFSLKCNFIIIEVNWR